MVFSEYSHKDSHSIYETSTHFSFSESCSLDGGSTKQQSKQQFPLDDSQSLKKVLTGSHMGSVDHPAPAEPSLPEVRVRLVPGRDADLGCVGSGTFIRQKIILFTLWCQGSHFVLLSRKCFVNIIQFPVMKLLKLNVHKTYRYVKWDTSTTFGMVVPKCLLKSST